MRRRRPRPARWRSAPGWRPRRSSGSRSDQRQGPSGRGDTGKWSTGPATVSVTGRTHRTGRQASMGEFKGFLTKSNALALAIGVIIGGALGAVVNSLVNDIIMPPIGLLLGNVNFSDL